MASKEEGDKRIVSQVFARNEVNGLQSKEYERTELYKLGNPNAPIKIVVSMRDRGEGGTIVPIVKKLLEESDKYCVSAFADGPSAGMLKTIFGDLKPVKSRDVLLSLADEVGDKQTKIALLCQAEDSGIDMSLVATAKGKNIVSIAVDDLPGVVGAQDNGILRNLSLDVVPDYECVMDDWSKDHLFKLRRYKEPNFNPDRIIVTGSPNFDEVGVNKEENRREFRERYGIGEDETVIVWAGQAGEADSDSLKLLVEGLKVSGIENYRFILRRRPGDERSPKFFENVVSSIKEHVVDTSDENDIGIVRQAADVVATMFSTVGVQAVCEGTPTITVLVPEYLKQSGFEKTIVPIAEDGSAAVVREEEDMVPILRDLLLKGDNPLKQRLKKRMGNWKIDGKATGRIVTLIKQIIE